MIFDSRGRPTVEAEVTLESGIRGYGLVPAGASKGFREAIELRDNNPNYFNGLSVTLAINNVHSKIGPSLLGVDVTEQEFIDSKMIEIDGTGNKSHLGANAILAVSMACSKAAAIAQGKRLYEYLSDASPPLIPLPEIQIFGGGAHSAGRIDIQDFMITAVGATSLTECYQMTFDVYRASGNILARRNMLAGVADEGGFWPAFENNEEGLQILTQAIEAAGYELGSDICISLDVAATEFYDKNKYRFTLDDSVYSSEELAKKLATWCERYAICSIEDPFAENDFEAWIDFNAKYGDKLQIVGDDLFTTHAAYIRKGTSERWANSVLIKPNQIGTVTETLEAIRVTKAAGWRPIISARSGETEDTFISHLAVATGAGQLKVGSFTRSERMAKWNELIRIERHLGKKARWANEELNFPWST